MPLEDFEELPRTVANHISIQILPISTFSIYPSYFQQSIKL